LTDAKRIAGHGNWLPWLEREFGWTEQTALNFMRVHAMVGKSPNFGDLNLPVSGLYLLAAPSTPEEARAEVIERAEQGEALSVSDVKRSSTMLDHRGPRDGHRGPRDGGGPIIAMTRRVGGRAIHFFSVVKVFLRRAGNFRVSAGISAAAVPVVRSGSAIIINSFSRFNADAVENATCKPRSN
jgi:hypothetical protein